MSGFQLLMNPVDEVYLYDGSLAGFYCCIHACVYQRALPADIQPQNEAQMTLLPPRRIPTDRAKALGVRQAIARKISPRALELCENVFLTHLERKEMALLQFLRLGFQRGRRVDEAMADPVVAPLWKAERHLRQEAHLLCGFVRFSDHQGKLLAAISPKNFVLPLLAPHFADRYALEAFLIYDRTHQAALVYDQGHWELRPWEGLELPPFSQEEQFYQALWSRFYDTIAIRERENPLCRRTHMPMRYWENMVEMQSALTGQPRLSPAATGPNSLGRPDPAAIGSGQTP